MRQRSALVALALAAIVAARCGESPTSPTTPPPSDAPRLRYTTFLTFGDSFTDGEATPLGHNPRTPGVARGYPFKLQTLLSGRYVAQSISVYNGGFPGEKATADHVLPRLAVLLDQLEPEVLIVMHGVNDLNAQLPIADTVAAIRQLVGEGRRRQLQVVLVNLPPQRPGGERAFAAGRIQPFNESLAQMATVDTVPLVDVYSGFPLDLLAPDGLHITQAGNELIAQRVFDRLRLFFEVL